MALDKNAVTYKVWSSFRHFEQAKRVKHGYFMFELVNSKAKYGPRQILYVFRMTTFYCQWEQFRN